jgi:hypothetical protein
MDKVALVIESLQRNSALRQFLQSQGSDDKNIVRNVAVLVGYCAIATPTYPHPTPQVIAERIRWEVGRGNQFHFSANCSDAAETPAYDRLLLAVADAIGSGGLDLGAACSPGERV